MCNEFVVFKDVEVNQNFGHGQAICRITSLPKELFIEIFTECGDNAPETRQTNRMGKSNYIYFA